MIVSIPIRDGDDKTFIACIEGLIASIVEGIEPRDLYIVRVDKWFDHKWHRYSGYGIVPFPYGYPFRDTAKDDFSQDNLTFPPFNPKQVSSQLYWKRLPNGVYQKVERFKKFHKIYNKAGSTNLHNRVSDFTNSGLFVWFSSYTEQNRHGSIMVYGVSGENTNSWYASLQDINGWKVGRVKGVDKDIVQNWFPLKTET